VCQDLLANLQSRGLRTDRSLLVILDGSKALRKAVRATFGEAALVQRCQVHKTRNILEYLGDRDRAWAQAILRRAYQATEMKTAQRLLLDLARRLEAEYPSAAESVREGLEETLTVMGLGLSERLQRSLTTTNAAESLISRTRHVKRNVKRWRGKDDAPLGCWCPRGCQRLPPAEGGTVICPRWWSSFGLVISSSG
jgi:transposase-like protein